MLWYWVFAVFLRKMMMLLMYTYWFWETTYDSLVIKNVNQSHFEVSVVGPIISCHAMT